MINNGLDFNKLHIVGHSLGGQMAGNLGRKIKEKSNNTIKLRRITSLDPAFPPFYPGWFYKPINKKDAILVQKKKQNIIFQSVFISEFFLIILG